MTANRNRIVGIVVLVLGWLIEGLAWVLLASSGALAEGPLVAAFAAGDWLGFSRALFAPPLVVPVLLLAAAPLLVWVASLVGGGSGAVAASQPEAPGDPKEPALPEDPDGVALRLLATLQEEARLLDFVSEEMDEYSDAEVGAAARGIHQALRRSLADRVELRAIREEEEGSIVEVPDDVEPGTLRVVGAPGSGPNRGTLVHGGWYATEVRLPRPTPGSDARVLAPAEVEVAAG